MKKITKAFVERNLNALQLAQLKESIRAGSTVKLFGTAKSVNKGWSDMALFAGRIEESQTKLF
jgi:hypothetical protein